MIVLLPLVLPWICGPLLLLFDSRRSTVAWIAAALMGAVTLADLTLLWAMVTARIGPLDLVTGGWSSEIGIRLHVDAVSLTFGAACAAVMTAALVHEAVRRPQAAAFAAMMFFMAAGLHGAFFTGDLFNFFVFFEVSVVSSFALAAYGYGRQEARGAFIYIGVNLLGSVFFLSGVTAIYHATGTLDLVELWRLGPPEHGGVPHLGAVLLFLALSLKLGLFPLHYWVPVLYSHAHPAVAAVMAGALINIGAYGLLRIGLLSAAASREAAAPVLAILGAAAVVYGAMLALRRGAASEVLAYASVAQAGYVALALGIGDRQGVAAAILAALAGSFEKAAGFLSLASGGRARAIAGLVAFAGLAGLPPTLGFLAKLQLVRAAWDSPFGGWLVAALILGALFLFAATARFWEGLMRLPVPARPSLTAPLCMAAASVLLFLAAAPLETLALRLADELLLGGGR